MSGHGPSFDIFCRVVDNFGDIGVCWRLAKQLAKHPNAGTVRLWVDDLASFGRIEPGIDAQTAKQNLRNVEVWHWIEPEADAVPHDVVIEAFGCTPPAQFITRMQNGGHLWINLEYLSAEDWVQGCHGLPSIQPQGLTKHFFFPGFTEATGGLLHEPDLAHLRTQWLSRPETRRRLLRHIGLPEHLIELLESGWRQVFIFCYPDAPVGALAQALARSEQPTVAIVPHGVLENAAALQSDKLQVFESPFVDQESFDQLLWSSDLNIVRGEDSLLRAIWAEKPFIWNIYPQDDSAHKVKLDAWLAQARLPATIQALFVAWNVGSKADVVHHLNLALQPEAWSAWRCDTTLLAHRLAAQTSLAERLLAFCAQKSNNG